MADYLDRIRRYQTNLSNPIRLPGGYQTGNVSDIASRYSVNPQALQTNQGGLQSAQRAGLAGLQPYSFPPTGAAGVTGPPSASEPSVFDNAPMAQMPSATPPASEGVPAPAKNARQRWMEAGGSQHTLNRANVARGVRSAVDARSNPNPKNSTTASDIREKWGWDRAGGMDLPY